jgi:hypothetical protein
MHQGRALGGHATRLSASGTPGPDFLNSAGWAGGDLNALARSGVKVGAPQPGDLVIFNARTPAQYVAMYVGGVPSYYASPPEPPAKLGCRPQLQAVVRRCRLHPSP